MNVIKKWFLYRKMVREVPSMKIYDGRGKGVDIYMCEDCGGHTYTRYRDKGVTPFCITCRTCNASAEHHRTVPEDTMKDEYVIDWVRPTFRQFLRLGKGTQEHVLNGGLVLEDELQGL